jgi:hypothetical protein
MAATVTVTGDDQAARQLVAIGVKAAHQRPVMQEQARRTARQIKGIPVDTGQLAASIEVLSASDEGFEVGTRVNYARYVFEGTKYVRARPPRVPATVASDTASAVGRDLMHVR